MRSGLLYRVLLSLTFVAPMLADEASLDEARQLLVQQKWADAESILRPALLEASGNGDASALLGFSLYHQKRFAEAVTPLERAVQDGTEFESRT